MTPKKALIIVLTLFVVVAIIFAILYVNKQQTVTPANVQGNELNSNNVSPTSIIENNQPAKPAAVVEEKINKIIEEAKANPKASPDTVRQEIISTINVEIIKQEENKTPEEKTADQKAQEERQKIIDQINNQIQ